jgi:hypothetical protein
MSLLREPSDWDQADRSQATEPFVPHKVIRRSVLPLARGALACPDCDLPVVARCPMRISALLECPFCREARPARQFLRVGHLDTALNEVEVRARMPL